MKVFLSKIYPAKDEILEEYISNWKVVSFPKHSIITEADRTESYLYYIKEGIQKSYFLNDGKEHIMFFAYPPSFSGVMESFLTQTPSKYYLETITDSTFLRISYQQHSAFLQKHRALERLFRIFTEQVLLGVIERHHELMAYDTKTRFKNFARRSPHLFNMLTQKDIASYLRIDPTNFSKLMNSIKI